MSEPSNKKGGGHLARKERKPKVRKPKRPDARTKQQKLRGGIFVTVTILAALVVAAFVGTKLFFVKPTVGEEPTPPMASGQITVGEPGTVPSGRKEDFFTFLVIGRDTGGGGNTDTILLAGYDVKNQKLNVMSIPRDTMVNVSWDIKRINSVYNFGGGGEKGIQALDDELSQLVGFRPDFQVVVEWKAVGELVDALGGVYYDVPRNMEYWDPTQNLKISQKAGYRKLTGNDAMQVVRFRDGKNGYANGDLGRIETQQGFLKAVVEQCLKIENVTRVDKLAKVFKDNVNTNLTLNNLAWFAQQAIFGGLNMENVNFVTMPCTGEGVWSRVYKNKQSYVVPNTEELVALVNECFNPYLEDMDSKDLDIMYVNSDGTIGSSTGSLEDKKANDAWQTQKNRPKATQAPTPEPTPVGSPAPSGSPMPEGSSAPSGAPTPEGSSAPSGSPMPESSSPPSGGTPPPTASPSAPPETSAAPPPAESAPASQPPVETPTPPAPTPEPPAATQNPNGPPEGIPIL